MRVGLFLIVFFCLPVIIFAQDYTVSRIVFLPSIYHVGDRVELRLSLRSNALNEIQLPQQLPQPDWGVIQDVRVLDRDNEKDIRIIFTSYYPGTQTMPPINLGPVVLNDISIFVTSLLDQTELAAGRGQIVLPGTQLLIIFTAIFTLSLPLLVVAFIRRCRRFFIRLKERFMDQMPYRDLEKKLNALTTNAGLVDGRNFYIDLLDLVREYLSGRMQMDARVATTHELKISFDRALDNPADRNFLIGLFHHGDLVKFASQPSTLKSRMDHLDQLEEVLTHIETSYKRKTDNVKRKIRV